MLDVIRERAQGWFAKVLLAIITIPFALWGIDSYLRDAGDANVVASVGKHEITLQEFTYALRNAQEQSRGQPVTPVMKEAILNGLITQSILAQQARKINIVAPDAMLQNIIGSVPELQEDGKFSPARYDAFLKQQGLNVAAFEDRLRRNIQTRQMEAALTEGAFLPRFSIDNYIRLNEQVRVVSLATLKSDAYMGNVKLENGAAKAYYDKHPDEFRTPEEVRLEYLTLSQGDLAQQIQISEEEINKHYQERKQQFESAEERRASHILIKLAPTASDTDLAAASGRAEDLLQQAKKNPAGFADLAKKHSEDPGSASSGGDLGFFRKGIMAKSFEEAVFKAAKEGDIVPARSEFGFHVIRITGIKAPKVRTLEEARHDIVQELRKQKASSKFVETAETFGNMVYEQSDSLKPTASALGLTISTSGWVSRKGMEGGPFSNPKLLEAVFSEDALKNKRNTASVEVTPGTLVSARVTEHRPSALVPFDKAEADIINKLKREQALSAARNDGKAALEKLRQGQTVSSLTWGEAQQAERLKPPQGFAPQVMVQAFKTDTAKLPGYSGVETPEGYVLIKVSEVRTPEQIDDKKRQSYKGQFKAMTAREYGQSWVAQLRRDYPIEIKKENLEKSDR